MCVKMFRKVARIDFSASCCVSSTNNHQLVVYTRKRMKMTTPEANTLTMLIRNSLVKFGISIEEKYHQDINAGLIEINQAIEYK